MMHAMTTTYLRFPVKVPLHYPLIPSMTMELHIKKDHIRICITKKEHLSLRETFFFETIL